MANTIFEVFGTTIGGPIKGPIDEAHSLGLYILNGNVCNVNGQEVLKNTVSTSSTEVNGRTNFPYNFDRMSYVRLNVVNNISIVFVIDEGLRMNGILDVPSILPTPIQDMKDIRHTNVDTRISIVLGVGNRKGHFLAFLNDTVRTD